VDKYDAGQLLLCAGAWIGELFPDGREMFAVYRQLLYWFPIREGYPQLRDMPAFVWDLGGSQRGFVHLDGFYGFPAVDGPGGGVKVAAESYERTTTPDRRQHPGTQREIDRMYERCIAPYLPWLGARPLKTVSCHYTCTRGSRFVIDRHPEHDSVLIVSACSGHCGTADCCFEREGETHPFGRSLPEGPNPTLGSLIVGVGPKSRLCSNGDSCPTWIHGRAAATLGSTGLALTVELGRQPRSGGATPLALKASAADDALHEVDAAVRKAGG
jgi:hypothetical protein